MFKIDVLGKFQLFLLPGGTLKLYFKNVIVTNFIECIKLIILGHPQNIIMWVSSSEIFHMSFECLSKILCKYRSCFFLFLSTCLPTYLYVNLSLVNVEKTVI